MTPGLRACLSDGSFRTIRRGSPLAPTFLIVSRASCVFQRAALSARSRVGIKAATLKSEQDLSFTAPRSIAMPDPEGAKRAGVWSWETARADGAGADLAPRLNGVLTIPEPLARMPAADGVRLVGCLEGVEGEVRVDGALVASRWWPAPPSADEWAFFLRGAGAGPLGDGVRADGRPAPVDPDWRAGWPPLQVDPPSLAASVSPLRLAGALAAAGLAFAAFDGVRIVANNATSASLEARLTAGGDAIEAAARLRRSARARSAEAVALASVGDEQRLVDTLLSALAALPPEDLAFQRATFLTDELRVEARVRNAVDGPALVARLEAEPGVTEAYVENAGVGNILSIRLKTQSPLAPYARSDG